jgi:hypothetical protein
MNARLLPVALLLPFALSGCLGFGGGDDNGVKPVTDPTYSDSQGAPVVDPGKDNKQQEAGTTLGVNAYLWRGALDTLSFMPLASADPFGGVIITDWYSPPTTTGERFKATAYILGQTLRADGVRVTIFRQVRDGGEWVDAPVNPDRVTDIENKVLEKARELRAQQVAR